MTSSERAHGRFRRSEAGAAEFPVEEWAAAAEISIADIERCVAMIAAAKAMVVRVELGIQQGVNSTLNSYLEKLLIMLTGSFGRKGTNQLHSWLQPLWGNSPNQKFAPTGDEVIAGLLPPNIFPDAVLNDHPDRLRGVWIDSSNPANTASNTKAVERALRALELCVVVDVAMTETARLAHYVLPASSQYEKTEFTLFNFEFPTNYFHVRAGVCRRSKAPCRSPKSTRGLPARWASARRQCAGALAGGRPALPSRNSPRRFAPSSRKPLGRSGRAAGALPHARADAAGRHGGRGADCGTPRCFAPSDRRKRCGGRSARRMTRCRIRRSATLLFDTIVAARQGTAITRHEYDEVWSLISHPDRKVGSRCPACWNGSRGSIRETAGAPKEFPFMLAAGQRRMFNANQIFRDPAWRRDDPDGALLINSAISTRWAPGMATGSPSSRLSGASSSAARSTTPCGTASSRCRTATVSPIPHVRRRALTTGRGSTCSPRAAIAIPSRARPTTSTSPFAFRSRRRTRRQPARCSLSEFTHVQRRDDD
jgi:hypothetical protein